jgi:signal recognition particle subunit SRP54
LQLTKKFEESVREKVNLGALAPGLNKRKVIQQVVLDELVQLVDPGKKPFKPRKGQCNVIMFVGELHTPTHARAN